MLFALSDLIPQGAPWVLPEATCVACIFFSVSVGVAIFRYRLDDIVVILSRAIVLGVLAAFVTVGYVVVVVAIGAVLIGAGAPSTTLYWTSTTRRIDGSTGPSRPLPTCSASRSLRRIGVP